jgi:hypothetical protein
VCWRRCSSRFDLTEQASHSVRLGRAKRANCFCEDRGIRRPHPFQHCLAGCRQHGVGTAPIIGRGLSSEEPGLLEPVNELRHPATTDRQPGGELAETSTPLRRFAHSPEQVVPAERGQAGGGECLLDPSNDGSVGPQQCAPGCELCFGNMLGDPLKFTRK